MGVLGRKKAVQILSFITDNVLFSEVDTLAVSEEDGEAALQKEEEKDDAVDAVLVR